MNLIYKFLLISYLIVGIIPTLESIDKVSPQWLYINLLNTLSLLYFLYIKLPLQGYLTNKSSLLFISLLIWSSLSIFFSINRIESVVVLSQFLGLTLAFIVMLICFSKLENAFTFISYVISIYLIIELAYIYSPFFRDLESSKSLIFSRSSLFLGFAANVNITAFSIIYKIPFFIFSLLSLKKINSFFVSLCSLIIFLSIIFASGTLNSTRSAILTCIFLAPLLTFLSVFIYFKSKEMKFMFISFSYVFALILSFQLNTYVSDNLGKSQSKITNRLSTLNALIDDESKDTSISQRRAFYSQAINFIISKPIFGTGLGNWKIKSIDTNKDNIIGYQVPYHVHNDFLEIATEIGILGLFIYVSILFIGFKDSFLTSMKFLFNKVKPYNNYLIELLVTIYFFIFLVDSNLNFPFARPIVIINLIAILAYSASKQKKIKNV